MKKAREEESIDVSQIDKLVLSASKNEHEFEILLTEFRPFLWSRASRFAGNSHDKRDEMMNVAMQAFYEAVSNYDQGRGHFFHFMDRVVHMRLIDAMRKLQSKQLETVPLETDNKDDESHSQAITEASIKVYKEDARQYYLVLEIDAFKQELNGWDLTMDELVAHSPKHSRLRDTYWGIVESIAADAEIMHIIWVKHYFPVKKISALTGIPRKTVERARIFIIATLIIRMGDYVYLKHYVTGDRKKET